MASPGNRHCVNCIGTVSFPKMNVYSSHGCGEASLCIEMDVDCVHYSANKNNDLEWFGFGMHRD